MQALQGMRKRDAVPPKPLLPAEAPHILPWAQPEPLKFGPMFSLEALRFGFFLLKTPIAAFILTSELKVLLETGFAKLPRTPPAPPCWCAALESAPACLWSSQSLAETDPFVTYPCL